jgi:hypothetical protein
VTSGANMYKCGALQGCGRDLAAGAGLPVHGQAWRGLPSWLETRRVLSEKSKSHPCLVLFLI